MALVRDLRQCIGVRALDVLVDAPADARVIPRSVALVCGSFLAVLTPQYLKALSCCLRIQLPLFRYSLGLSGLPPFSTFALSFSAPLFHPPSLCCSSTFLEWPVKPVRKKVQRVLSFASSPSESLEFASHPVFRQAFLGSSSPVRRGAGGGGSRRSSQRSSRYSACCVTAPPTPFLPLSPVGGGGGAGGGGGGGAGGGSRTVTASSCWGGEGGFAEGGGVEFGEERKAHAPQHFTAIPANYAGFGMIETREGAAPVVGSKTTTTTTTT